jgi:hypothetical protein
MELVLVQDKEFIPSHYTVHITVEEKYGGLQLVILAVPQNDPEQR